MSIESGGLGDVRTNQPRVRDGASIASRSDSLNSELGTFCRTAMPALNRDIGRHSAALGEFGPPFLNGLRGSVNRKVQGSGPCPGAIFEFETGVSTTATFR